MNWLYRYLRFGCAKPYPTTKFDYHETEEKFFNIKLTYLDLLDRLTSRIEHFKDGIFQLSGGFDSSLIASYFYLRGDMNTMCMEHEDSTDVEYSKKAADFFHSEHQIINERQLLDKMDFKQTILDINKLHSYPRAFKNDSGLYAFVKWAKENYNCIIGGEGLEFQMLGYDNIHSNLLNLAIARGEYDIPRARFHLNNRECMSPQNSKVDIGDVLKFRRTKPRLENLVTWWSSNFDDWDIYKMGVKKDPLPEFQSVNEALYFLYKWYGEQYLFDRREDYLQGFEWHTPFLDDTFVNYTFTVPMELKNCMGHHKFVLYETMHDRLPMEIIQRPKSGLMTDFDYYRDNYESILELVAEFLDSKSMKIYNHLDYDAVQGHIDYFDFIKVWSLLNLSIWMETHETDNPEFSN